LQQYYEKDLLNALNLYLYGVVLKEKNRKDEAKQVFLQALNKAPLLWSAWLELSSLLSQKETDYNVVRSIRSHWMLNFYFASFHLEA
jgi:tetratricopeptide (TPR) repeat protein